MVKTAMRKSKNEFQIEPHRALIILRHKGIRLEAVVDVSDLPIILALNRTWHAQWSAGSQTYYCRCRIGRDSIALHRLIVSAEKGTLIDHRNHNGLDNRKENLRVASHTQNLRNRRKRAKWVYQSPNGTWYARYMINRKRVYVGRFSTYESALQAVMESIHTLPDEILAFMNL